MKKYITPKQYKEMFNNQEAMKAEFLAFEKYMNSLPKPSKNHTEIGRINFSGNYEPGNIRWATKEEFEAEEKFMQGNDK